ncbi:COP9 signalosome complex subunit 6 [Coelomomyces lativittatus]|nr:COP9 signalosome complex subunit 6 [Coelomomyces lativittatus]
MDSSVSYSIHPLVFINIADHLSRNLFQHSAPSEVVYGALLGCQNGCDIEIYTSFELTVLNTNELECEVDTDLFSTRQSQYKQVLPAYRVVGWYSTSTYIPGPRESNIHRQLMVFSESLIFFQLNPKELGLQKLPATLFEASFDPLFDQIQFFEVNSLKIATSEAEFIAVDTVAKVQSDANCMESQILSTLSTQKSAIEMLLQKVLKLLNWVEQVEEGKIPIDHSILRSIGWIVQQLPTLIPSNFNELLSKDYEDVLLTEYLSILSKTTYFSYELVDQHLADITSQGVVDRTSRKLRPGIIPNKYKY